MNVQFVALIPAVYAMIEGLEWFGLKRNIAHLLALPIGILMSFILIPADSWPQKIIYGLIIGLGAAGTCDTVGNCKKTIKPEKETIRSRKKK